MLAELSRIDDEDVLELRFPRRAREPYEIPETGPSLALRHTEDSATVVHVSGTLRDEDRVRAELDNIALADGRWHVLWIDANGDYIPVTTRDCGFSTVERMDYLKRPRQRELRTVRRPDGQLLLCATTVTAYAEVEWVEAVPDTVTVSGLVAYASRWDGGTAAELVAYEGEHATPVLAEADITDGRFHCDIPLRPIVAQHDPYRRPSEWELWLRIPWDSAELRLGAHADDIAEKKRKIVYPQVFPDGGNTEVFPYYTVTNELSLRVREVE